MEAGRDYQRGFEVAHRRHIAQVVLLFVRARNQIDPSFQRSVGCCCLDFENTQHGIGPTMFQCGNAIQQQATFHVCLDAHFGDVSADRGQISERLPHFQQ